MQCGLVRVVIELLRYTLVCDLPLPLAPMRNSTASLNIYNNVKIDRLCLYLSHQTDRIVTVKCYVMILRRSLTHDITTRPVTLGQLHAGGDSPLLGFPREGVNVIPPGESPLLA